MEDIIGHLCILPSHFCRHLPSHSKKCSPPTRASKLAWIQQNLFISKSFLVVVCFRASHCSPLILYILNFASQMKDYSEEHYHFQKWSRRRWLISVHILLQLEKIRTILWAQIHQLPRSKPHLWLGSTSRSSMKSSEFVPIAQVNNGLGAPMPEIEQVLS